MVWVLATVFGSYFFATAFDEIYFHRKRGLNASERTWHHLNTLFIALGCTAVAFLEYKPQFMYGLYGLALLSVLTKSREQTLLDDRCTRGEHWWHGLVLMLHPLMLIGLIFVWPFINGVGLFLGAVLPFSTAGFKLLGYECFGAFTCLWLYQVCKWKFFYKSAQGVQSPTIDKVA